MDNDRQAASDAETILMALDQISQTIEAMTSVVGRLRAYVQEQRDMARTDPPQAGGGRARGRRTVH